MSPITHLCLSSLVYFDTRSQPDGHVVEYGSLVPPFIVLALFIRTTAWPRRYPAKTLPEVARLTYDNNAGYRSKTLAADSCASLGYVRHSQTGLPVYISAQRLAEGK